MNIGIDQLSFYTPHYYLELAELAAHHQIDPGKYRLGIGQERMAVAPPDEDIISMAANAAAVSVHRLLQLPANSRTIELNQACYSATAALQLACAHIARHPARKVLILAADIAKYDLDSAAEPTQGAAAVAMLISANPRLATIAPESGLYSEDIYDFWRPNHRKTPLVDGKYSTLAYLKALDHAWQDYRANKMGIKAHAHLARINGATAQDDTLAAGLTYSRETGNSYTASLYASLAAMLDNRDDLGGKTLGLFSYGSGCTGEYLAATIHPDYREHRRRDAHRALLAARQAVNYTTYREWWHAPDGTTDLILPQHNPAPYRLAALENHRRRYDTP